MIYKYNYTEQTFGGDTTKQEAHDIAEAIQWAVQCEFDDAEFVIKYDPNWVSVNYFEDKAEEELAADVARFVQDNWSDIAGRVLDGTFWE